MNLESSQILASSVVVNPKTAIEFTLTRIHQPTSNGGNVTYYVATLFPSVGNTGMNMIRFVANLKSVQLFQSPEYSEYQAIVKIIELVDDMTVELEQAWERAAANRPISPLDKQ